MIEIQLNLFDSTPQLYGLTWKKNLYWDEKIKQFVMSFDVEKPLLFQSEKQAEKAKQQLRLIIKNRKYKRKGLYGIDQVVIKPIPIVELKRMATSIRDKAN